MQTNSIHLSDNKSYVHMKHWVWYYTCCILDNMGTAPYTVIRL